MSTRFVARQCKLLFPRGFLLLFGHVRIVVAVYFRHDSHDLLGNSLGSTTAVNLLNSCPIFIQNSLSVFSEHSFNTLNDRSSLYHINKELLDVGPKHGVVRVVNHFPLILCSVKHGLNSENRNDLLLVTFDVVLEVEQCSLDRALE
jgi:hypothetical protein